MELQCSISPFSVIMFVKFQGNDIFPDTYQREKAYLDSSMVSNRNREPFAGQDA